MADPRTNPSATEPSIAAPPSGRRAYVAPALERHDDWHLVTGQIKS